MSPEDTGWGEAGPHAPGGAGDSRRLYVVFTDHGPGGAASSLSGPTVLLLHGNPTWAYLYRRVLAGLGRDVRCVAPDYPGFGRTDRPSWYGCRPREHAAVVVALLRRLELRRVIVVGHDWGGPIGLAVAAALRDRVEGVVLSNTWCWRPDLPLLLFSLAMGGRGPGRWLQLRRNFFVRRVLPAGMRSASRRPESQLAPYRMPFPTPASRLGTWVFPRAIRTEAGWVEEVRRRALPLDGIPAELVWGMRDPALGREAVLARWRREIPGVGVDRVEDAAHYVPEDRPDRITAAARRVIRAAQG